MNTQTPKQEALSLLAKIEKGAFILQDMIHLHELTTDCAEKQGVAVRVANNEFIFRSVDACLKLPKPEELFWDLEEAIEDSPFVAFLMDIEALEEPVAREADKRSLACAMLKCWWAIQED